MIRKIVLGLDVSDHGRLAQKTAVEQAARWDATLVVSAAVDDRPQPIVPAVAVTPPMGVFVGTPLPKDREAARRIDAAVEELEGVCVRFGVRCEVRRAAAQPVAAINDAAPTGDVVMVPSRTHFMNPPHEDHVDVLRQILSDALAPTVLVPADAMRFDRVLVAYDGSRRAAAACRSFNYQFLQNSPSDPHDPLITVLSVASDRAVAERQAGDAASYLGAFGHAVETAVETEGPAGDVVLHHARRHGITVLGASVKGAVKRLFFGGVTETLLTEGGVGMYVAC